MKSTPEKAAGCAVRLLEGAFLVLLSLLLVPRLFGLQVDAVTSGSMEPAIPVGALTIVQPADFADIREGDIITFHLEGSRTRVTHRVAKKDEKNRRFFTKGDANAVQDAHPVDLQDTEGIVRCTVPGLGRAAAFAGTWEGKAVLASFFVSLLALDGLLGKKEERSLEK